MTSCNLRYKVAGLLIFTASHKTRDFPSLYKQNSSRFFLVRRAHASATRSLSTKTIIMGIGFCSFRSFWGSECGLVFSVTNPYFLVFAVKLANILMFTVSRYNTVKCLEGFSQKT